MLKSPVWVPSRKGMDAQVTNSSWFAQDYPGFKIKSCVPGHSFLEQHRTISHPRTDEWDKGQAVACWESDE